MAGEADILSGLGVEDLNTFSNLLQKRSVPRLLASSIGSAKIDTSRMNPYTTALSGFLQGLLTSGLNQYAQNDEAEQLTKVNEMIPQLYADPSSIVSAPEGVDEGAFNILKGSAEMRNAQRNLLLKAEQKKTMMDKPWLGNMDILDGSSKPAGDSAGVSADTATTLASNVPKLSQGKESTNDRIARLTNDLVHKTGENPTTAGAAARMQVAAEIKSNGGSFDQAKAARDYANNLLEIADRAEQGLTEAEGTAGMEGVGPGDIARGAKLWVESFIPGEIGTEAKNRLTGRSIMDSIKSDLVKMKRSPGAVSDYENRNILAGGPTTDKTAEANAQLIQNWRDLAQYNLDYADFLEAYRDQNMGSTVGADKLWQQYRMAHPLYSEGMGSEGASISTQPPKTKWQEFFSGAGPSTQDTKPQISRDDAIAELKRRGKL